MLGMSMQWPLRRQYTHTHNQGECPQDAPAARPRERRAGGRQQAGRGLGQPLSFARAGKGAAGAHYESMTYDAEQISIDYSPLGYSSTDGPWLVPK